jgi:hypothetical protein
MLDGPLGQLFRDLDKIPASDRSSYEDGLHRQIKELGLWLQSSSSSSHRLLEGEFRNLIKAGPSLRVEVDLSGDGSDVTRLRCSKPDCPNKRTI